MDEFTIEIGRCPACQKHHEAASATRKPGADNATHEAECPDTGKRFPVWHSGDTARKATNERTESNPAEIPGGS